MKNRKGKSKIKGMIILHVCLLLGMHAMDCLRCRGTRGNGAYGRPEDRINHTETNERENLNEH